MVIMSQELEERLRLEIEIWEFLISTDDITQGQFIEGGENRSKERILGNVFM